MCNYNGTHTYTHKIKNDMNLNIKEVIKNGSYFRICSNLRNHQPKVECCKHSLVYMKHLVTTNQKSTRDIEEIKRKEPKDNSAESHQHTREESTRVKKEQRRTNTKVRKP